MIAEYLHHASAEERNDEHEEPAGDERESPGEVAKGNSETQLGTLAVVGVEPGLVDGQAGVVALESQEVLGGGGGQVDPLFVNVDLRGRGEHIEDPKAARAGGPAVAENGLVIAVEQAYVRRIRERSQLSGRLVESSLELVAVAWSSVSIAIKKALRARCAQLVGSIPKQVLFRPVTSTHHSSGTVAVGATGP